MSPLENMAQDSLEWYVEKAETASEPVKPLCWLGGGLSGLMTPENAWATEIILSLGASWGLSGRAGGAAKTGSCPISAKTTSHGFDRLLEQGWTDEMIANVRNGLRFTQKDGSLVYIKEVSPGSSGLCRRG